MSWENQHQARYMEQCEPLVRRLALAFWEDNPTMIAHVEGLIRRLRDDLAEDDLHPSTLLVSLDRLPLKVLNHLERKRITRVSHLVRQDFHSLSLISGIGVGAAKDLVALRDELKARLERKCDG